MKAILCTAYGSPDVLEIQEVNKPEPKAGEVRVKVIATSVNSGDVRVRALDADGLVKLIMRIMMGFFRPRQPILGTTFSGIVDEVGDEVATFTVGDEVFGSTDLKMGCHAEYVVIKEQKAIARKPLNATFEEAAAIPFGGHTALYFLKKANLQSQKNSSLLIYGASGSVGSSALQVARLFGVKPTAVCSSRSESFVRELGAEDIILYDQEDVYAQTRKFDVVFDAVGKIDKKRAKSILKKGGKFFSVASMDIAKETQENLEFLSKQFEEDKYTAPIDTIFPFEAFKEAHHFVDAGKKQGNVVLRISTK